MTSASKRWVIYATFQEDGKTRPHAVEQVRAYRDVGFDVLVVDSSPLLQSERVADWSRDASAWIQRDNEGYDFESFRAGVSWLKTEGVDFADAHILLTNDSCFGPYTPLGPVFQRFDSYKKGLPIVFGITDSYERGRYHLQSYWLYFRPESAPLVAQFFEVMPTVHDRLEAIEFGELAISEFLLSRKCSLQAWCGAQETLATFSRFRGRLLSLMELFSRRVIGRPRYGKRTDEACILYLIRHPRALRHMVNQTLAFGALAHVGGLTPFLKQSLLRENPLGDPLIPKGIDVSLLDNAGAARLILSSVPRRPMRSR